MKFHSYEWELWVFEPPVSGLRAGKSKYKNKISGSSEIFLRLQDPFLWLVRHRLLFFNENSHTVDAVIAESYQHLKAYIGYDDIGFC